VQSAYPVPTVDFDSSGELPAGNLTTQGVSSEPNTNTRVQRFELRVIQGPELGRDFRAQGARAVIGTHQSADLVLTDRTVSRFHCEITYADGRFSVKDLGSRNGTWVDGVWVEKAILRSGQTLMLGHTHIRFDIGHEVVEVPLSSREHFGRMRGRSDSTRAMFALLEKAAHTDATVLLMGETGTGKEAAAEAVHSESTRANGPFVVIDCGSIPPDLIESELFGHERGSFTGAVNARQGAFEAANGGTIFLDEIGELPADLQPKLLRALERREIKRVGSNRYLPIDVRVIAATNRDLKAEVNERKFRSDLYYRLAVVEVHIPALRERPADIPVLVDSILESHGGIEKPEAAPLRSPQFLASLARHSWPGNVRELRNHVERCLALRQQLPVTGSAHAQRPELIDLNQPFREARDAWTKLFERRYLETALERTRNNVTEAARAAGIDRMYFYRLLWRHRLR
jgi:DNA-binding NtrC family response regulator